MAERRPGARPRGAIPSAWRVSTTGTAQSPPGRPASTTGTPAAAQQPEARVVDLDVGQQEAVDAPRRRQPLVRGQRGAPPRRARAAAAARSRRRSAPARSRTGSARRTSRPRAASASRASTSPTARVRASVSARALADGRQPSSRAAARIRSRVPEETPGRSLTANETAAAETPARRATSAIVGRRRGAGGSGCDIAGAYADPLPAYDRRGSVESERFGETRGSHAMDASARDRQSSWPSCRRRAHAATRAFDDRPAEGPARGGGRARGRTAIGFQDGRFYANGWHITGEMGGIWAPPLKLADGDLVRRSTTSGSAPPRGSRAAAATPATRSRRRAGTATSPHRLRPRRPPRRAVRARAGQPERDAPRPSRSRSTSTPS